MCSVTLFEINTDDDDDDDDDDIYRLYQYYQYVSEHNVVCVKHQH